MTTCSPLPLTFSEVTLCGQFQKWSESYIPKTTNESEGSKRARWWRHDVGLGQIFLLFASAEYLSQSLDLQVNKRNMNRSSVPAVRLSCEECKRRKTKCDKLVPCTACRNAGIKCNTVQRARKPRGRTSQQKGGEIDTRVARLEDLVKQLKVWIH